MNYVPFTRHNGGILIFLRRKTLCSRVTHSPTPGYNGNPNKTLHNSYSLSTHVKGLYINIVPDPDLH